MKKFLMFILVAISAVSFGLTIYYFSADNEVIYINASYLVVDVGDTIPTSNLLSFKNKDEDTTLSFGVSQSDDVLSYSANDEYFTAVSGGESKIVVTTSNRSYSSLVINVEVCDGSADYPYIISNEEQLSSIGNTAKYTSNLSYKLGDDIALTENIVGNWTPIANFSGTFDGNFLTISNVNITETSANSLSSLGLFSNITSTGTVKNLFLDNVTITSSNATYIGSVAGTCEGKIQTTEVTGQLSSGNLTTSYVGGVVGYLKYNSSTATQKPAIDRCGFEGKIETTSSATLQTNGGVVGYNFCGRISESYYRATTTNFVENNFSNFGGVVGRNEGSSVIAEIYDCYFYLGGQSATTTNQDNMGGIIFKDVNSTSNNTTMGNYFSGLNLSSALQLQIVGDTADSTINTKTNGYLSQVKFTNESNFATAIYDSSTSYWDFDTVWTMGNNYPFLNVYSSVGSTFSIDTATVQDASDITTATEFYNAISGKTVVSGSSSSTFKVVGTLVSGTTSEYEIDFSNIVWGDGSYAIPNIFSGTIVCENGCVLKNLTIKNSSTANNVGLVAELAKEATISGLFFENVRIIGRNGQSVGVIAGLNDGASVSDISISDVSVEIGGKSFGSLFGTSLNGDDTHAIKYVDIQDIDASNNYFILAGGVVGNNASTITSTKANYSSVKNVKLYASYSGGVTGNNSGKIEYVSASDIYFNHEKSDSTILDIYSGETHSGAILENSSIYIGGVAGLNTGSIYNVYVSANLTAESGGSYRVYMGGVAGESTGLNGSSSIISRAYVYSTSLKVTSSHGSTVGGVAGYDKGTISNCVVDNDTVINTIISNSTGTSTSGTTSTLSMDESSVVGGIVGYEAYSTNSSATIYQCISQARTIKGFYAGGIAGVSYGKISSCAFGISTKENGNVEVNGFLIGGIASLVGYGYVKDCSAVCKLNTATFDGTYTNVSSVINLDVSASGGIVALAINSATIRGNYTVATFSGTGVSFAICADTSNYTNPSKIIGNVYQTEGSVATSFGTKLSQADLTGSGTKGFSKFQSNIGSEDYANSWSTVAGKYPQIENLEESCPDEAGSN
jgi:hypothetical protein